MVVKTDPLKGAPQKTLELLLGYKKLFIAYSGGLDSHVLLHLLTTLYPLKKLIAIHVNHHTGPDSLKWARHCQKSCNKLQVKFISRSVDPKIKSGDHSPEEHLRKLRYQVFAKILPKAAALLTAHHADDQAETLLLQLFRGAGVKGLAAMAEKIRFASGWLVRPLLNFSRQELLRYARKHQLEWVEDRSNLDLRFDRNLIRHQLLPSIKKRWPQIIHTLNRVSHHLAEADELLGMLANQDLASVMVKGVLQSEILTTGSSAPSHSQAVGGQQQWPQSVAPRGEHWVQKCPKILDYNSPVKENKDCLEIGALKKFTVTRQKNCLRFWLYQNSFILPSKVKLNEVIRTVINSRYDATSLVKWDGVEVRRFRNYLYALPPLLPHDNQLVCSFNPKKKLQLPSGLGELKLKFSASFKLDPRKIRITFRRGGEKIKLAKRGGSHDLKKLMQEWHIPPWLRDRTPLLYYGDQIIAVVGYYKIPAVIQCQIVPKPAASVKASAKNGSRLQLQPAY